MLLFLFLEKHFSNTKFNLNLRNWSLLTSLKILHVIGTLISVNQLIFCPENINTKGA
jgi:hypothetical protein